MNKCIIFLSKKEKYLKSAYKIKKNTKLNVDIIYIEDFIQNINKNEILEDSIIYFLCNSNLNKEIVNIASKTKCYIFNKRFFENNYTKLEIQKLLIKNKLCVPKIATYEDYRNLKYPVFCKENRHAGIVFKAYTNNTVKRILEKFDQKDFYIEESIECQQEIKYYYIKGNVYCKDTMDIPNVIYNNCDRIAKLLKLDIFSMDVIKNNNSYMIIDVNSSAGFYLLDDARNNLIYEIEKLEG